MAARFLRFSILLVIVTVRFHNVVASTYSSRIIHRFSDEAKALRVSRSKAGNEKVSFSWPKRKSLEYYQMLVANDFHKQKMKLGSQFQLLFPSEGSSTMSFGNNMFWLHYTWIDLGTPNVSFLVALDAGSNLLWVPCDCIQCAPLSATYYNSRLDRDLNEYSPSGSSTSKNISCSHRLCDSDHNCQNPNQSCLYIVNYSTENTSSSGMLVQDILHLASSNGSVQAPVIIGCGRKQSGGYLGGVAPDGLLGLGPGEISVPSFLSKAGFVRNSFSLCFNEDYSGRIYFGDQGPVNQRSTSFLASNGNYDTYFVGVEACCIGNSCHKDTSFRALVDSGTSFTFLPQRVYEKVSQEFVRRINATSISYDESPWKYCYETSSQELPNVPTMTLMFPANNSFLVHDPIFLIDGDQGIFRFCLAIQPVDGDVGIIGQNFMIGYRLVFDREKMKLGWSNSKCQDLSEVKNVSLTPPPNPLPTNEKHRAPGGHAVAPAVAGRTPSKPSAACTLHLLWRFCWFRLPLFVVLSHVSLVLLDSGTSLLAWYFYM